jgi:hypothetical protein
VLASEKVKAAIEGKSVEKTSSYNVSELIEHAEGAFHR